MTNLKLAIVGVETVIADSCDTITTESGKVEAGHERNSLAPFEGSLQEVDPLNSKWRVETSFAANFPKHIEMACRQLTRKIRDLEKADNAIDKHADDLWNAFLELQSVLKDRVPSFFVTNIETGEKGKAEEQLEEVNKQVNTSLYCEMF